MQLLFPILVILSSSKILNVFGKCRPSTYSVSGFHLSGHEMSTMIVSNLSECVTACITKIRCKSLNFRLNDKSCHLNNAGRHAHPEDYGPKAGFIYMDVSESPKVCIFNNYIPNAGSFNNKVRIQPALSLVERACSIRV